MNPIFGSGPSLPLRLSIALVISLLTITYDVYTESSKQIRSYLNTLISPIQYLANLPEEMLDATSKYASTKATLLAENKKLRELQLMQNEKLQRYGMLVSENAKLRALLKTNERIEADKSVAEIMAVASNPFSQYVLIDKGTSDDVFQNQPVIDDLGVVGQIFSVGTTNSRVILITDQTHATPVRLLRNDIRGILHGTGNLNQLELVNLPHGSDIKVGDLLITSGLGQVFPDGYPVAEVTEILPDVSKPFMKIVAKPVAQLDRLKHVLLLKSNTAKQQPEEQSRG
ncbi:MAG: rod shape-determining protein MreC [Gammaproteobacteria bacterium]|nr:rod shape-determining protein MreC [Gammaproteobacteria bacterium]